jgi:DNA-binding NarL/FixJ family response regulator
MEALLTRGVEASPGSGPAPISVLAIVPEEMVWCGIRLMLGRPPWLDRYLVAGSLDDAAGLAAMYEPEVLLVDMKLPECSPEESCETLRLVSPRSRLLLLSAAPHVPSASVAAIGAHGFISKNWPSAEVVDAIHRTGLGLVPVAGGECEHGLSGRQMEVLQLLAEGRTNDEIAALLELSRNTVKQHTSAVYRKLAVRNRAAAIGSAQAMGLLS